MFSFFQKHPRVVSSDSCFHNLFLKSDKDLYSEKIKPKIKLHNYKNADRTAEGCNINSQNRRPHLSFPVVTVQVIKIYSNLYEEQLPMQVTS